MDPLPLITIMKVCIWVYRGNTRYLCRGLETFRAHGLFLMQGQLITATRSALGRCPQLPLTVIILRVMSKQEMLENKEFSAHRAEWSYSAKSSQPGKLPGALDLNFGGSAPDLQGPIVPARLMS